MNNFCNFKVFLAKKEQYANMTVLTKLKLKTMPKIANIGFFAPKPYITGIDWDFLFDRKFCLVEIFKR